MQEFRDQLEATIFKPKWHGRPMQYAHHATGFDKNGKSGRYELQN